MEKAERLMRKYGYGYIHSKDLLNEPYVQELENVIDELEKWLKKEMKQYDNVGLKFKKQGNFECASRCYDCLKQYQTILSKLQELKGDK